VSATVVADAKTTVDEVMPITNEQAKYNENIV
jgi:hypothetical protein